MKQVSLGLILYSQDYDDRIPRSRWVDSVLPYIKNESIFRCLEAERVESVAFGRALEVDLFGRPISKVHRPESTDMVFDSAATPRNAVARISWGIARPGRHQGGTNIGFVDGHVKWLRDSEAAKRWPPITEERTVE